MSDASTAYVTVGRGNPKRSIWSHTHEKADGGWWYKVAVVETEHNPPKYAIFDTTGIGGWMLLGSYASEETAIRWAQRYAAMKAPTPNVSHAPLPATLPWDPSADTGEGSKAARSAPRHKAVSKHRIPTYAAAREALFTYLRADGWKLDTSLKIPHATSPDNRTRVWFKAQAVYVDRDERGYGGHFDFKSARSSWFDIRLEALSPARFAKDIQKT